MEKEIRRHGHVLLMLDYDGTLTPIVREPHRARLAPSTRAMLEKLHRDPRYTVAVISGRALKDVRKLVGITGLIYAGNHGLELSGPKIRYLNPRAKAARPLLRRISRYLEEKLADVPGALVENKGLSLSVHFRRVKEADRRALTLTFHQVLRPYRLKKKIRVAHGKCLFEVRPPVKWDKGKIVTWLVKRTTVLHTPDNILPIYLGDDLTDEDAFRVLAGKGVTARVGRPDPLTHADYRLRNVREVRTFLNTLAGVS